VLYELLTGKVPFTGESPVEIAMKHLSAMPEQPSALRDDIPPDVDKVVLRALAKTPEERYPSAETMDRDLARVAQGVAVSRETEEAATQILSRGAIMPPVVVDGPPRPPAEVYYDYEEPRRPRAVWPWILVLLLLLATGLTGYFVFQQVQDELASRSQVAVPFVVEVEERQAVAQVLDAGLQPNVIREPNPDVDAGFVFDQSPDFGTKVEKGTTVDMHVSTGPPQTEVPDVIGETRDDAIATLARRDLDHSVHEVFSAEDPGTVVGQDPKPGETVNVGTRVRLNVSKGKRPVVVPPVVGQPFENAKSALEGAGFRVTRRNVESTDPAGTVVGQDPAANTEVAPGATIVLSVSKGPKNVQVPDVTNQDEPTATSTLKAAGFNVNVERQQIDDPGQNGFVISQDPAGGSQAPAGTTVTIVVGQFTP
jgi:serine/threonine-protein kinase